MPTNVEHPALGTLIPCNAILGFTGVKNAEGAILPFELERLVDLTEEILASFETGLHPVLPPPRPPKPVKQLGGGYVIPHPEGKQIPLTHEQVINAFEAWGIDPTGK